MGGWTAATEVQQEIFLHFALISVELANSFWPRKLSAFHRLLFPMRNALQSACRTFYFSASGGGQRGNVPASPARMAGRLLLRQQGAELLHHGVQLVCWLTRTAEPELLQANPGADLQITTPDEESVRAPLGLCEAHPLGYRRLSEPGSARGIQPSSMSMDGLKM